MPDALNAFLWVASVCTIILTVLGAALAAVLIATALEARALMRRVQTEMEWFADMRRHLLHRTRFAGKWLRIMGNRLIR